VSGVPTAHHGVQEFHKTEIKKHGCFIFLHTNSTVYCFERTVFFWASQTRKRQLAGPTFSSWVVSMRCPCNFGGGRGSAGMASSSHPCEAAWKRLAPRTLALHCVDTEAAQTCPQGPTTPALLAVEQGELCEVSQLRPCTVLPEYCSAEHPALFPGIPFQYKTFKPQEH